MDEKSVRENLISLLDTLKRNLEAVSREVLKTRYKKPYEALTKDISMTTSEYLKQVTLQGTYIRKDYLPEVKQLVEALISQSGLLKQISQAAFIHQDIKEIDMLALSLRKQIHGALEEYYAKHLGFYLANECFEEPPKPPMLYNDVTGCILDNDVWKPLWSVQTSASYEKTKEKGNVA